MNNDHGHDSKTNKHHHYILPDKLAFIIIAALLALTAITVWTASLDFGVLNFPLAMFIATTKASLVALIFMNLKNDSRENGVIFATSFLFLAIFIVLTASDLFFRGDVYVKGPLTAATGGKAKFKKPWNATPEILANGKELFAQQCTSCHGDAGLGNGPAASGLSTPPRNFTAGTGWKNGAKPSEIYKTLKDGIAGTQMASFATLAAEDRWSLAHYVNSLNPQKPADTAADLAKAGVDPSKDTMDGGTAAPTISIQLAMARMVQPAPKVEVAHAGLVRDQGDQGRTESLNNVRPGARFYQNNCASCHGVNGEGAIAANLGVSPKAYLRVKALVGSEALGSMDRFKQIVARGIPGDLMPGNAQLSGAEMSELFNYARGLSGKTAATK